MAKIRPNRKSKALSALYDNSNSARSDTPNFTRGQTAPAEAVNLKGSKFKDFIGNHWNQHGGLTNTIGGVRLGTAANIASGLNQGMQALGGLQNLDAARDDTDDLISRIINSAAANPSYRYDLTTDQLNTLRQLQNGTWDNESGFDLSNTLSAAPEALLNGLIGFGTGGWLGAGIGAGGSLLNAAINGNVADQQQKTAALEGLYQALLDSEDSYRNLRRTGAYNRLANRELAMY